MTKFEGELAEPIYELFEMRDPNSKEIVLSEGFLARISKLKALARHYDVEPNDWFALVYAMACDLVPGFEIRHDHPGARALKLPTAYYGNGTKPKGSGDLDECWNGDLLIWLFRAFKQRFPEENDIAIADRVLLEINPELKGAAHEAKRAKLSKTLRNRLGYARREAAQSQKHPIS